MAGAFNGDTPRLRTMRGRLKAIQEGYERCQRDLTDEARSKESRQWIKLAHEVTERRDLEKEVKKILAAMEKDRESAERGEMGASQGDDRGEGTDLQ